MKNISNNCTDVPAIITYFFDKENKLILYFYIGIIYFYIDNSDFIPGKSLFRSMFPSKIAIVPTLGPLEYDEDLYKQEYIEQWSQSHRANRFFRNLWYFNKKDFHEFQKLVEETWQNMSISLPEYDVTENRVNMFCQENRMTREVSWAGYGFQIWMQILTHILRARDSDLIVIDEPEIYLHADLQKKILQILRDNSSRVIIATHSVEIINEADPDEVLIIDKNKRNAYRLSNLMQLQKASDLLGSSYNIHLTRLAKGKKILFVEGKDGKILNKLAQKAGYSNIFLNDNLIIIPLEGFTQWEKVVHAEWTFKNVLGQEIEIAVLLDKDYRVKKQLDFIKNELESKVYGLFILRRKEIENYLLDLGAIDVTIRNAAKKRDVVLDDSVGYSGIEMFMIEVTDMFRVQVFSQYMANELAVKEPRIDDATVVKNFSERFDEVWKVLLSRIDLVPGKDVISCISQLCQERWKFTISSNGIINSLNKNKIPDELIDFFTQMRQFVSNEMVINSEELIED